MTEELLAGGNVADAVVRAGDTVRKPWTPATPFVHAFLHHLREKKVPGVPEVLGRDEQGRQVLAYVPGVQGEQAPPMTLAELHRLGAMVRALHDASEDFVPPPEATWDVAISPDGADLVCHQDLAPWNLIRDGDTWTFIDWDASAPGTRLWDLAYVAQSFAPLVAGGDPAVDAPRLQAVLAGYDLDEAGRAVFPELLVRRTRAMYDLLRTGGLPWSRLWAEGHGVHWGGAADYLAANLAAWR